MCSASYLLSNPVETVKGRKPHTKLQQKCIDLADTLPPLTEDQKKWARSKMQSAGYLVTRGRGGKNSVYWCQECGQLDPVNNSPLAHAVLDECKEHVCSRCGRKLSISGWRARYDHGHTTYNRFEFGVVTTCAGMQVVRVFCWNQTNTLGSDTINHIFEVFQTWFDPIKGKEVILSKPYTRSFYHFRWSMYGGWKVKQHNASTTGYYAYDDVYALENRWIYPRAKILPILRRNGWSNGMFKMRTSPVEIWKGLLTDPVLEGLAKTKQYNVIDYWFETGGMRRDKSLWLPLIKICNRQKYIIQDASMWFDYIDILEFFHKDIHNAHYICPADLKKEHDRLFEKKTRIEKARELAKRIAEAEKFEAQYKKHRGMFFGICFGDKRIMITVIGSVKEMAEEGTMMHHCVYANEYYNHQKHPDSLILSAKDKEGNRLETIEVNIKTWKVMQSRGVRNNPTPYHNEIVSLVNKNIGLFKEAI